MKDELPIGVKSSLQGHELVELLDAAGELVVFADQDWVIWACSDAYLQHTGLTRKQVIGHTPFSYLPTFDRSVFYEPIERCRTSRKATATLGYSTLTGKCMLMRVFPVNDGMLLLANDASESVIRQYQLAQVALEDSLTRLPNKLALGQDIDEWVRLGQRFTFTTIRVGNLRPISDSHGAAVCDLATIELASRLQLATVPGERVYQITHDEFVHLCPGAESPERIAAVLAAAKKPLVLKGALFDMGIAAGIAKCPEHADTADLLSLRASMAVHEAERTKTSAPVVYVPSLETALRLKAQLEGEVKEALSKGEFTLFLQPKASLAGLHVTGAEALIRWHHATRGWIGPAEFLSVIEGCGLMRELDKWVINAALEQIRTLSAQAIHVPVSINLSVHSLADPDIVARIREGLRSHDVAPHLLEIEIPEGGVMRDVETSIRVLRDLHDLGIGLSIDDFGTGYSSFAYLTRFPIQTLKIDRSFVLEMAESKQNGRVVAGLVKLAHSIGLKVVAEGAETSAQIAMLRRFECDEIQGYGYARPMPLKDFHQFAQDHMTPRGPSAFTV